MKKQIALIFLTVAIVYLSFDYFKGYFVSETDPNKSLPTAFSEAIHPKIKNVILITLCTFRLDHSGLAGYIKNTTPFLDWLASNSVVFENTRTVLPLTGPAHASIFTSLYPIRHKMMSNYEKLDDSFLTIAEILKDNGFKTAAFVSSGHLLNSNVGQGFDEFSMPKYMKEDVTRGGRPSYKTLDLAKKWLDKNSTDPVFLWIHLSDPHLPYIAPDDFVRDSFSGNPSKKELLDFLIDKQGLNVNFFYNKEQNATNAISLYDSEMMLLDAEIKSFFDYTKGKSINSETLWIVVGDHGEGLGSHDFYEHGVKLYEEQLRIPFFLYSPSFLKHKIIDKISENIDVLPTLLDLLSISKTSQESYIDGESLVPLIFENDYKHTNNDEYGFSCSLVRSGKGNYKVIADYWKGVEIDNTKLSARNHVCSLQSNEFKYILNKDGNDEFYDLKKDPLEKNNLIDILSAEKDKMKKILLEKIDAFSNQSDYVGARTVDEQYWETLEREGYIR